MPNKEGAMLARYSVTLSNFSSMNFTKSNNRIKMLSSSVRFFSRFETQVRTSGKKRKNRYSKQKYSCFGMIGLVYWAQAGLGRLCKMEVRVTPLTISSCTYTQHWKFHILQLRNAEINEEIIKRRATAVLSWLDCSSTAARLGTT